MSDYPTIACYGVVSTPAVVIDEQLVLAGPVPTKTQLAELLTAARATR